MRNLIRKEREIAEKMKKGQNKKKAFTLVEILIVVAVIGILFVTLVPRIDFAGDKARETGIKTDFRSFELAAEQLLRENAGLADFADTDALCGTNGINLYLDKALQFTDGTCAKNDQWNQPYTLQVVKPTGSDINPNNGAIIFVSNGKDSLIGEDEDNYVLVVTFVDGQIESETSGFSSNIESAAIDPVTADSSGASMTIADTGIATVKYKN
jgi:general secretion pathway protein G